MRISIGATPHSRARAPLYTCASSQVDTTDDRRVDETEFIMAMPKLREWGVKIADPKAEFAVVDADGGGKVLFDEFAGWAIQEGLDMDDDDDDDEESLLQHHSTCGEGMVKAMAEKKAQIKEKKARHLPPRHVHIQRTPLPSPHIYRKRRRRKRRRRSIRGEARLRTEKEHK